MAPQPTSTSALPAPQLALPASDDTSAALMGLRRRALKGLGQRLQVDKLNKLPRGELSKQDFISLLGALESETQNLQDSRNLMSLSDTARGKVSADAGIATSLEWDALLHVAAQYTDPTSVARVLNAMRASGAVVDSHVLTRACAHYVAKGEASLLEWLLQHLEERKSAMLTALAFLSTK